MYDHVEIAEASSFEHGMKIIERTFEKRLRNVVELDEMQMRFMPGTTIGAIFTLRLMLKKYEMAGKIVHDIC